MTAYMNRVTTTGRLVSTGITSAFIQAPRNLRFGEHEVVFWGERMFSTVAHRDPL